MVACEDTAPPDQPSGPGWGEGCNPAQAVCDAGRRHRLTPLGLFLPCSGSGCSCLAHSLDTTGLFSGPELLKPCDLTQEISCCQIPAQSAKSGQWFFWCKSCVSVTMQTPGMNHSTFLLGSAILAGAQGRGDALAAATGATGVAQLWIELPDLSSRLSCSQIQSSLAELELTVAGVCLGTQG